MRTESQGAGSKHLVNNCLTAKHELIITLLFFIFFYFLQRAENILSLCWATSCNTQAQRIHITQQKSCGFSGEEQGIWGENWRQGKRRRLASAKEFVRLPSRWKQPWLLVVLCQGPSGSPAGVRRAFPIKVDMKAWDESSAILWYLTMCLAGHC